MRRQFDTHSEEETRAAGRELAATLPPSVVVAFSGDLGCGKTAFIRGMCEAFDCAAQVNSPTFTIINEYTGSRRVTHCDLYRLASLDDFLQIGLDEILAGNGTVLVEWAERAVPLLPFPRYEVGAWHGTDAPHRRFEIRRVNNSDESLLFSPDEWTVDE
ncbi:MAG: tRNA (adenosine(37)-N6)-threonylcarbamoyltransferase complex ATPase subunit type 1 TsaE [Bacteroidota bacterium]|jgi:tRNA threonylcarbamoyladenosine biosynthesis protein TsaE|nr:tRNA (adenosine(37)-N6)-threonylcarbamoyltransferase complex ATPase subunit type 1 TsaE [Bacteroidota bacterium]